MTHRSFVRLVFRQEGSFHAISKMDTSTLQLPDLSDARFRSVMGAALYHPKVVATRAFLQATLLGLNTLARLPSRSANN